MYHHRIRFLFVLLCLLVFCSAVQATNLLITVQDSIDNTTVSHATVYLSGANVGMTNTAGQFLLQSGQGDLNLRISQDGYDDWSNTISGNVTTLSVTLVRRSLTLNVRLYDSNTLQSVSGASLTLASPNSSQTKTSDSTGSAMFGTTSYTYYMLNITAQNYQPRSESIETASDKPVRGLRACGAGRLQQDGPGHAFVHDDGGYATAGHRDAGAAADGRPERGFVGGERDADLLVDFRAGDPDRSDGPHRDGGGFGWFLRIHDF